MARLLEQQALTRIRDKRPKGLRPWDRDDATGIHLVLQVDNPDGLRMSSQLFQIGVILIEIALDSAEVSDLAKDGDPRLFVSETLPLVYKAVGADYYRACAFCVQDRSSPSFYRQHHKYEYPEQTGWEVYIKGLLMEYHVQVVSRKAPSMG